jgi:hypothetical protein
LFQKIYSLQCGKITLVIGVVNLPEDDNWGQLVLERRLLPKMDRRTYYHVKKFKKETEKTDYKLFSVIRGVNTKTFCFDKTSEKALLEDDFFFVKKKFFEKGTRNFMTFAWQH